jgi:hypothetical protein
MTEIKWGITGKQKSGEKIYVAQPDVPQWEKFISYLKK